MASAAAQAFFDRQSPKDRMAIIDSWGGRDLTDEWFKNAQAAGSVPAAGSPQAAALDPTADTGGVSDGRGGTTRYTGPADTNAWQTNVGMTNNAHPDAAKPSGDPFVDMIRNAKHGSEDYQRFSNAQILAWKSTYDPEASRSAGIPKFKNEFGDIVDKPTEGGAQSHAAGYATGEKGGGKAYGGGGGGQGQAAAGGGGAAKPAYFGQDDPLQRHLTGLATSGATQFGGASSGGQFAGGGVFTQGQHGSPAAPAPAANPAASNALQAFSGGASSAMPTTRLAGAELGGQMPATNLMGGASPGFAPGAPAPGTNPWLGNTVLSGLTGGAPAPAPAPAAPQPDAFGVQGGATGSFEDLVNPRRASRDARNSNRWF